MIVRNMVATTLSSCHSAAKKCLFYIFQSIDNHFNGRSKEKNKETTLGHVNYGVFPPLLKRVNCRVINASF